jgi:hypothetical protein
MLKTTATAMMCWAAAGLTACSEAPPANAGAGAAVPAAPAAGSAFPDPCSLVTDAEVGEATGNTPDTHATEQMGPGAGMCTWTVAGSTFPVAVLNLTEGASSSWDEFVQGMVERGYGNPQQDGERIDLGRFGYYDGTQLQVHAETGLLLTFAPPNRLRGDAAKAAMLTLARAALSRLK